MKKLLLCFVFLMSSMAFADSQRIPRRIKTFHLSMTTGSLYIVNSDGRREVLMDGMKRYIELGEKYPIRQKKSSIHDHADIIEVIGVGFDHTSEQVSYTIKVSTPVHLGLNEYDVTYYRLGNLNADCGLNLQHPYQWVYQLLKVPQEDLHQVSGNFNYCEYGAKDYQIMER